MIRTLTVVPPTERAAARVAFLRQACERVGWQPAEQGKRALSVALGGDRAASVVKQLIRAGELRAWEVTRDDGTRLLRWEVLA